jgi:hypothetical protein
VQKQIPRSECLGWSGEWAAEFAADARCQVALKAGPAVPIKSRPASALCLFERQ